MQKQITLVPVTGTPHHGFLPDGTGIPVLHAAEPHESVKGQSRRFSDIAAGRAHPQDQTFVGRFAM
jgi:hypothetical protein